MPLLQPSLNGVLEDCVFLQNLPSMAAAHALSPAPGSRVLDMCAAPGGKTTHLAQLMRNDGFLLAVDKNAKKTAKIRDNCRRFGIDIVQVRQGDSSRLVSNSSSSNEEEEEKEQFDFILLDPPCSGLGQRPSFMQNTTPLPNMESFPAYQRELFKAAWKLLAPGGSLVYSTCTVNPAENELMVAWVLQEFHGDIELLPLREEAGGVFAQISQPGLQVPGLTEEQGERCLCRFWPDSEHDSIGFFICKFRKSQM